VRDKEGKTAAPSSNIVFHYGHCTIPRHLRDIVITEYGIADLRSKTDSEVAKALIHIADSRFQPGLLAEAKKSGKVEPSYEIPDNFRHNTPSRLESQLQPLRAQGWFGAFPFGTDLTAEEIKLGKALKAVKSRAAKANRLLLAFQAWRFSRVPEVAKPAIERLGLSQPKTLQDRVVRMLLSQELSGEK